tara:strand:- start:699 stop:905 length:207 start_codon:yes stop_codon:yes gene_type:complete
MEEFTVSRNDVVTPKEAAKILNKSPQTVYNWTRSGVLPSYRAKNSGRLYILRKDLDQITLQSNPQDVK